MIALVKNEQFSSSWQTIDCEAALIVCNRT